MEKQEKVLLISSIVLVGFIFAVFYHYFWGTYLHYGVPLNTFLADPFDVLCDFYRVLPDVKGFMPYLKGANGQMYFPLAYLIFAPFVYMKNVFWAYFLYASIFMSGVIYWNIKILSCDNLSKFTNIKNIFIMSVLSYPLLFLLDRGNFDMIIFVIFAAFIFAFQKEKYILAAVLLGLINAMKPFSVLFLFLFLFKKKYKEFFLSAGMSFILVTCGFFLFKGAYFEQIGGLIKGLTWFKQKYVYENNNNFGMGRGSSLFMLVKLLLCKSTPVPIISTFLLDKIYTIFWNIASLFTLVFVCREKIFWKQITLLTCNMLLFPYYMEDYKLIFLFVPIWLFIMSEKKSKNDFIYAILLALMFIPKNVPIVRHVFSFGMAPWYSLSIIINPIVMLTLMSLIIYEQFKKKGMDVE